MNPAENYLPNEPVIQQPVAQQTVTQQTNSSFFEKFDLAKILVSLVLLIVVIFVWQWLSSPMLVTVRGMGQVSVPATSATISLTVTASASNSPDSINIVKSKAENIRVLLTASGVAESDIAESQIVSYPAGLAVPGAEGFQSSIQMSAKTNNVAAVSELVGSLYNSGASLVDQPLLNVENQEKLEEQATKEALKDAKDQVTKISRKNFKFIRKMVALTEQSSESSSTISSKPDFLAQDFSEEAALNGSFEIAKLVTVSYKLW
jgi:uncharacterized protein YggE